MVWIFCKTRVTAEPPTWSFRLLRASAEKVTLSKTIPSAGSSPVEEALQDGVLGGNPVVDVAVEIIDCQAHAKDSNELAFRIATIYAVKDALRQAGAILLEPIMAVECVAPDEYRGDLLGDLNRRRGRIVGVEEQVRGADSVEVTLQAEAPLAELFGYANAIRSLSRGRASYSMRPARFEPVPVRMT